MMNYKDFTFLKPESYKNENAYENNKFYFYKKLEERISNVKLDQELSLEEVLKERLKVIADLIFEH